jgi:TatD DNase family protein
MAHVAIINDGTTAARKRHGARRLAAGATLAAMSSPVASPAPGAPTPPQREVALPPLVDSHCHLTWESFHGEEDAVIARARAVGVEQMVVVATDPTSAAANAALCAGRAGLYPTAGLHPNDLPDPWEPSFAQIESLVRGGASGQQFVAIGETGLDYYRDTVKPDRQRQSFVAHASLARERALPVIVHIRDKDGRWDAYDDVVGVLREVPGVRGVIHCYTGDAAHAKAYLDLGFVISFSGIITFPKGENVREAARTVPLDRCLVETDAPFLAPIPHRGKRCEPAFVADTARRLAEVKGVPESDLRRVTTATARALFGIPNLENRV